MTPAHVRQDHDSRSRGLLRAGQVRAELRAVGALDPDALGIRGGAADRVDRWMAVVVRAHGYGPLRWLSRAFSPPRPCRRAWLTGRHLLTAKRQRRQPDQSDPRPSVS